MRSLYARLSDRYAPERGMDRRDMIRRSLAAAAGILLSERLAPAFARLSGPRVGGRVITFRDLVTGGTMEGGAELIGSNHAIWQQYRDRFSLRLLDIADPENIESPILLAGKRLTRKESDQLWEEMDAALNLMNADAAQVPDAFAAWSAPGAATLDRRSLAEWIAALDASPLCKLAIDDTRATPLSDTWKARSSPARAPRQR